MRIGRRSNADTAAGAAMANLDNFSDKMPFHRVEFNSHRCGQFILADIILFVGDRHSATGSPLLMPDFSEALISR